MKTDSERDAILKLIRRYADQWRMAAGTSEEQHKWVIDYAEKQAEQSIKTIEYLDSKADAMMRYVGMLITLIALALTYAMSKDSPRGDVLFFLPVLMALLFSIWNALRCAKPTEQPRRPFIKEAFDYAQSPKDSQLYFMRGWVELEFRTLVLGAEKGNYVATSLYSFLLALVWLMLAIPCVIFKAKLSGFIYLPSMRPELLVLLMGFLSVVVLALYRRSKASRLSLADWSKVFPEVARLPKSGEASGKVD